MLSIPRDLWVSMPGIEGSHKINTAYRFGELYEMPGGGPGLALRTVEELLAVPVNFYAVIDFFAFEDFIDELGGIELDVPETIKVDPIGPDNTVQLEPGLQVLDGPTSLAYARNRSTAGDETDRAARQQQVILAIRDRVLDLNMLPRLVLKSPILYSQLQDGIRTNMTLEQTVRLAWLAQDISPEDIQRAAIGDREVTYDYSPDGQAIFVPIPERIAALRDEIFGSESEGTVEGPTAEALIAAENSRITIYNETGQPELGDRTAAYLEDKGLNVIQVVQNDGTRPRTRLVDHTGDPYTMRALIDLLRVSPAEIYIQYDPEAGTEFSIYLGLDWAEGHFLDP
jgi:LCP family protein required for cell wall assembly